jgi:hypothetical protein
MEDTPETLQESLPMQESAACQIQTHFQDKEHNAQMDLQDLLLSGFLKI